MTSTSTSTIALLMCGFLAGMGQSEAGQEAAVDGSGEAVPVGYDGPKYPPQIVVDAILEAIEKRRHEVTVPKRNLALTTARTLRAIAPSLLRAGMARMEPVPAEVVERARARAREKSPPNGC